VLTICIYIEPVNQFKKALLVQHLLRPCCCSGLGALGVSRSRVSGMSEAMLLGLANVLVALLAGLLGGEALETGGHAAVSKSDDASSLACPVAHDASAMVGNENPAPSLKITGRPGSPPRLSSPSSQYQTGRYRALQRTTK